jgi:hypothetical protein
MQRIGKGTIQEFIAFIHIDFVADFDKGIVLFNITAYKFIAVSGNDAIF